MTKPYAQRKPASRLAGTIAALLIVVFVVLLQRKGLLPSSPPAPAPTSPTATSAPTIPDESPPTTRRPVPGDSPGDIRIGSWNIEWLGKPDDRSGPAQNIPQKPEDIADYIVASGVSLLGVQEIVASVNSRPIRSHELESTLAAVEKQTGDHWEYVLFPGRQDGDQLTGILWNTARLRALDSAGGAWDQRDTPMPLPIERGRSAQGSSLWNRPPHVMRFTAGDGLTDFAVVVLHMKADYQGAFAAHRADEAKALTRALPGLISSPRERDLMLLGDTNCTATDEPALAAIDASGFDDTNSQSLTTHWRGGAMDKIFVPEGQSEFSSPRFEVMSDSYLRQRRLSPQDFKTRLSDHYMVVISLRISADDD